MRMNLTPCLLLAAAAIVCGGAVRQGGLTFDQRVEAQRAIERVYYSHQLDHRRPFDEAVPTRLLEEKVRVSLQRSIALERFWHTPITASALRAEAQRMARGTLMQERLQELHTALGNNPVLILECLVRPVLAERLSRQRFASDPVLHANARQEAARLRAAILSGALDPLANHPARSVTEIVLATDSEAPRSAEEDPGRIEVDRDRFKEWRGRLPERLRQAGPVDDDGERFVVRVLLEEQPDRLSFATYAVAKTTWDDWWATVETDLDAEAFVPPDLGDETILPAPPGGVATGAATTCGAWNNGILDDYVEPPSPRSGHTAVWTGSVVIVWGGNGASNTGGRYNPATDSWSTVSRQGAPISRAQHVAVWTGSEMLVWGGWNFDTGSSVPLDTGGRYDPVSDTWSPMTTSGAPSPRFEHTAVWTGTRMIVWGGFDGTNYLGDGASYDPASDVWIPIQTIGAPTPREQHTAVWTSGRMIIWGGWASLNYLDTGGLYDPVSDTWSATKTLNAPSARANHTAVWTGSEMIVYGGFGGSVYAGVGGRYNPAMNKWNPTQDLGQRQDHRAVWTGTRMLVWGAGSSSGAFPNGFSYEPQHDVVTALPAAGAPANSSDPAVVWTGDVMFIHGGYTGGRFYARYRPATDSWLPSAPPYEPRGRLGHSAVWTGNVMVVWGGYDEALTLNSGFRYDPVLDAVSPMTTLNAPAPLYGHTAVWSGSEMIVWGSGFGGRYDPVADSWAGVTLTGAPSFRTEHTAVWTGSEMIVWGGKYTYSCPPLPFPCTTYFNDGGRYNPATNTWQATTTTAAPSGRSLHSAFWTGSRMLIWGGNTSAGGLYDPATGLWTSMSTAGAPSPTNYVAVWTGDKMLVWGGAQPSGAQYSPASNQWTPTVSTGQPAARMNASAVWTGDTMLLWGGRSPVYPSPLTEDGARYNPQTGFWSPLPTLGAPEARYSYTGVWTGSSYLVWGGNGKEARLKSGGRFTPSTGPDMDGDGFDACGECDDGNPAVYPGAPDLCDGLNNDCVSPTWPALAGTKDADDDGDGRSECQQDCNDADGSSWETPGEPTNVFLSSDRGLVMSWDPPVPAGGSTVLYDVLRATNADGFLGAVCVKSDAEGAYSVDSTEPAAGSVLYYLVRADNGCPGSGSLGNDSTGAPRPGRACP